MQKEIYEQPTALINTMEGRINHENVIVDSIGNGAKGILEKVEHIQIVACGTSYNAGMVARYWFESLAGVSCDVEIASEFRYRKFVTRPNSLLITLSIWRNSRYFSCTSFSERKGLYGGINNL